MNDPRLSSLLQEATDINAASNTQPFLSDRIMRKVRTINSSEEYFFQMIWVTFKRILLASILFVLGFLSYNRSVIYDYDIPYTTTELVFGLKPMTLTMAYSTDLEESSPTIP